MTDNVQKTDFLIIGSGIAGLYFALKASQFGRVVVLTKSDLEDSATNMAQGGIAAVLSPEDDFSSHITDTLEAGAGLCNADIVRQVVENGPERARELASWGVKFTLSEGDPNQRFELALEGGHSHRRILHAGDVTGREIIKILIQRAKENPNITLLTKRVAFDLFIPSGKRGTKDKRQCWGAWVLNRTAGSDVELYLSRVTVLATGGAGKIYLYTSNPDIATGDGLALAYRAGATLGNLEFVQFHPTCLYHSQEFSFLISEALRGEGAVLRLIDGTSFMEKYHFLKDLAPRDIVARAIDHELKISGEPYVYLDITHKSASFLKRRFPYIYQKCLSLGYDLTREPLPVVPAAHYFCGGVVTNFWGQTDIPRLFAIGEVACTGLHGANRLASNSLLEALVFAHQAAKYVPALLSKKAVLPGHLPSLPLNGGKKAAESVAIIQNWTEVRRFMWNYVGISRSNHRLQLASERIRLIKPEVEEWYQHLPLTRELIELRNLVQVADLVIRSAKERRESRGLHYTQDYPFTDEANWKHDTLIRHTP